MNIFLDRPIKDEFGFDVGVDEKYLRLHSMLNWLGGSDAFHVTGCCRGLGGPLRHEHGATVPASADQGDRITPLLNSSRLFPRMPIRWQLSGSDQQRSPTLGTAVPTRTYPRTTKKHLAVLRETDRYQGRYPVGRPQQCRGGNPRPRRKGRKRFTCFKTSTNTPVQRRPGKH